MGIGHRTGSKKKILPAERSLLLALPWFLGVLFRVLPLTIALKSSTAVKGWGDGEGENCLGRGFPWNAKKNEMEPVEFSKAYEELAQMSIAGYTL